MLKKGGVLENAACHVQTATHCGSFADAAKLCCQPKTRVDEEDLQSDTRSFRVKLVDCALPRCALQMYVRLQAMGNGTAILFLAVFPSSTMTDPRGRRFNLCRLP